MTETYKLHVTETQHKRALAFLEYMEKVPWNCIDQEKGYGQSYATMKPIPCCFGAHGTRFFKDTSIMKKFHPEEWCYLKKADYVKHLEMEYYSIFFKKMDALIGISEYDLRHLCGITNPFGMTPWARHPKEVIKQCIDHMEVES